VIPILEKQLHNLPRCIIVVTSLYLEWLNQQPEQVLVPWFDQYIAKKNNTVQAYEKFWAPIYIILN
jgi:hypothetical protein